MQGMFFNKNKDSQDHFRGRESYLSKTSQPKEIIKKKKSNIKIERERDLKGFKNFILINIVIGLKKEVFTRRRQRTMSNQYTECKRKLKRENISKPEICTIERRLQGVQEKEEMVIEVPCNWKGKPEGRSTSGFGDRHF